MEAYVIVLSDSFEDSDDEFAGPKIGELRLTENSLR